jgi:hypothetical protein
VVISIATRAACAASRRPGDHAVAVELLVHLAQPRWGRLGLAEAQEADRQRHDLLGGRLDPGELADALVAVDPAEPGVTDAAERQRRDAGVAHHRVDRGHPGAGLGGQLSRAVAGEHRRAQPVPGVVGELDRSSSEPTRWISRTGPKVSSLTITLGS